MRIEPVPRMFRIMVELTASVPIPDRAWHNELGSACSPAGSDRGPASARRSGCDFGPGSSTAGLRFAWPVPSSPVVARSESESAQMKPQLLRKADQCFPD